MKTIPEALHNALEVTDKEKVIELVDMGAKKLLEHLKDENFNGM